jgi:CTP synthase
VEENAVIPLVTAQSIYEVPLVLEEFGLGEFVVGKLSLPATPPQLDEWRDLVSRVKQSRPVVRVGLVGKYVDLHDAYLSVKESLEHAALYHSLRIEMDWIDAEDLERGRACDSLARVDGLVVPGGFGTRGIEGKIVAARYAREHRVPYLGLCLGMQIMIIELARYALQSDEPNSTEFDPGTQHPVIDLLPEQRAITEMGGTMRLGAHPCRLVPGTRAWAAYGVEMISERRRHRFEVNNTYRGLLEGAGLIVSGTSPDRFLVEISELADHPWMLGTQFHPEFKSRPNRPHPLFRDFIAAARDQKARQEPLPLEVTDTVSG